MEEKQNHRRLRFAVFAGHTYYPGGGWEDHRGTFKTEEEAKAWVDNAPRQWWHIVDLDTGEIIDGS